MRKLTIAYAVPAFVFILLLCRPVLLCANDSAASISAGGIRLTREPRITMLKERLTIHGEGDIVVEYDFLNESDQDITTEVAFPVPPHQLEFADLFYFDDFRLWVDGRRVEFATDAKALHNGIDHTARLRKLGVDVATFGHYDPMRSTPSPDIDRLSVDDLALLRKSDLIDEYSFPQWTVEKTYHWNQTFPAHKLVHIRHRYAAAIGFTQIGVEELDPVRRKQQEEEARQEIAKGNENDYLEVATVIDNACLDPVLQKTLQSHAHKSSLSMSWVDYILTTANSWKTPIKDFELIVERPKSHHHQPTYMSSCWTGPVDRSDPARYKVHMTDFIPDRELRVVFFEPLGFKD